MTLTADAIAALARWDATGRGQSLLSMYPHDLLVPLVTAAGIDRFLTYVDGTTQPGMARKAPHLRRHLQRQHLRPESVVLIGDSVDDALAARECGTHCLVYHAGDDALHARDHFADIGVPVVETLEAAVAYVLGDSHELQDRGSQRAEPVAAVVRPQRGTPPHAPRIGG